MNKQLLEKYMFHMSLKQYDDEEEENDDNFEELTYSGFNVQKLESKSTKFPSNDAMDRNIILKHPFSLLNVGKSGSGKSTVVLFQLLNKDMYHNYFDEIFLFGRTILSDKLWDNIKIPKKNKFSNDLNENLNNLVKKMENESKKGADKMKRRLIIFEDISAEKALMRDKKNNNLVKLFVQNRHWGCSVIANSHKYRNVLRICRLSCHGIYFFPSNNTEIQAIIDDNQPAKLDKHQFQKLIKDAWEPTINNKRPFLMINNQVPEATRFRKSFTQIYNI